MLEKLCEVAVDSGRATRSATVTLSLKPNEKIFINGAVLQVAGRARIKILNDATFLLEPHVLQASDATTPLRQLYFSAQIMLIDPNSAEQARQVF